MVEHVFNGNACGETRWEANGQGRVCEGVLTSIDGMYGLTLLYNNLLPRAPSAKSVCLASSSTPRANESFCRPSLPMPASLVATPCTLRPVVS